MREINSKLSFHVIYMSSNERTRNFNFVLRIEKTKRRKRNWMEVNFESLPVSFPTFNCLYKNFT